MERQVSPFTFHSRQRKFLQWRDLLFSVDGKGCVHRPPPSFCDVFTHGNLPSLASPFSIALQSLLFSFLSILYPFPPGRIIVRVPYSFAAKAPLKKRAAMKIAIPFLSLDRIISLSKIYLSFASLSTSFVRREILLVFEMWSQIVWMTMMMLGIFRNNRNTSLISMNKLQKLISSLTSSCFHHFILCCDLSKKKKQNGWKLRDYKNNKKKKNWHGTHSHCTSIFSKIPFIIIFQTTASQFEKANFTHPPTPFLFFPPPPPLFSSVARRGQKASDEQNGRTRL